MINRYSEMLSYIHVATRNECTDAINIILDSIANTSDTTVLSQMYEHTLVALKSANNERLWFTTNLKLARVSLDSRRLEKVEEVLGTLKEALSSSSGSSDPAKGNNLLEVYCLEIQLCSVTLDFGRMRDIYPKTLNLTTTVSDPRTLAVIRENGGKLYMAEENWDAAYNELYQAFRNYQEAGNVRARDCLKYVVLASMLALTDINPFAAREAKVFAEDKEIMAMSELRDSLESNDLSRFERILKNKQNRILDEPFLMRYIEPLRRRMQEQAILNAVKPFRKVTIQFLADRLSLTTEEIERILVDLILDEKLDGLIDQSCGHVCINPLKRDVHADKQKHIADWIASLNTINQDFDNRMA